MEPTERAAFMELMHLTAQMYRTTLNAALLQMYWSALEMHPLVDIRRGLNAHIQNTDNGQFFPKPADILRHLVGNSDTQAQVAWSKVTRAIQSAGAWSSVVFDDARIHAVIAEMGGWVNLCKTDVDELSFKQNEFTKRYRGYISQAPKNYPRLLTGIADNHNRQHGLDCDAPTVIGDTQQARLVFKGGAKHPEKTTQPMSISALLHSPALPGVASNKPCAA